MDVADLLTIVDNHGFTDTDEADKLAALNETYWDVCGREPWRFLEKSVDLDFDGTSGVSTTTVDDLRAVLLAYRTVDGLTLRPQRADDFYANFAANLTDGGDPYIYYFDFGGQIKFYPVPPESTGGVVLKYLQIPAELTADSVSSEIVLPSRYHRAVLANGTLYKLYIQEDDTDLSAYFERLYEKALNTMREDLWKQQYDEPEYIHPVYPDDTFYG